MLEASIFTWAEDLCASFVVYCDSRDFKNAILQRKWVIEITMLEKVARDEVLRGYFSDEHADDLNYSSLKVDLHANNLIPEDEHTDSRRSRPRPMSLEVSQRDTPSQQASPSIAPFPKTPSREKSVVGSLDSASMVIAFESNSPKQLRNCDEHQ